MSEILDPKNPPMMACGHSANATCTIGSVGEESAIPSCVICSCTLVAVEPPSLEGRRAICIYCKRTTPSLLNLAYFAHTPAAEFDQFYDGCRGWD